ncbi:MAG: hypothetical protein COW01_13250 [Bdellovibrionales bacterium CG12_big_fil_rev_8_21_14_0_65_38_15]|nr:MAG: hypothetical protein COW79_05980 [Bdellovibrionales bacterium CG22_combo_CG10-13_8_21_14_all_38_13]PIQ53588.1 MAG: hypothetical protein COW01_13250 [Bdellovibrionales bacterium CG12_big_fil_rev_8_21_14_0_65_38_15]PIR28408.1 MAG: hypothetical protein COV38_15390 [Bdellovibrionales bacterium CG11_big_fil_rev_8_21_14_0_20_38_13]
MNELFDKLILRIVFTVVVCGMLFFYKYAHMMLHPSSRKQIFREFHPTKNAADTLHFFARLIGIGILFSEFRFDLSDGFFLAMLDFAVQGFFAAGLYLLSVYTLESIVLYNFEYTDEIVKKRNMAYAFVGFVNSIALATLLKTCLEVGEQSLVMLFFLWLFSMVLLGFAYKAYSIFSKMPFARLLMQQNLGASISYAGYTLGWTMLITGAIDQSLTDIKWYSVQVLLRLLLSLIIFPIFRKGIMIIFRVDKNYATDKEPTAEGSLGYGIFEGCLFFTSAFLTTVITEHIHFGTFYPVS